MKRDDAYFKAMQARDARFDGKFFVGVKTTGIYCRPICPAKPKRENVEFFANHFQAERAGYRPCLRCRPESAPRSPVWIGTSAVVKRAIKLLHHQQALQLDEDRFADLFGVSARHLRRLFIDEIGKTPKQLSFENRLNLARTLITETKLPISEVAFAAGFRSVRTFNESFLKRFKKSPLRIRRSPQSKSEGLCIRLPYRPPFDFAGLLHFYRSHQVGNLEWFTDRSMHRVVQSGKSVGTICIRNDEENSELLLEMNLKDTVGIQGIISKVRDLFDLDSDPILIANALDDDAMLKSILKKHAGVRLPSGWDAFEVSIGAILGQRVSVERGRTLVADLIELLGKDSGIKHNGKTIKLFPSAKKIATSNLENLKTTGAVKKTLIAFSQAVSGGHVSLEPAQDVDDFLKRVSEIYGIGPWTANYLAMKVLRHADAFPETDLILARALKLHSRAAVEGASPWRSYVAILFWKEYSQILKKTKPSRKRDLR